MADKRGVARRDVPLFGLQNTFKMSRLRRNIHMQNLADGAPSFLAMTNSSLFFLGNATQYSTPDANGKKISSTEPRVRWRVERRKQDVGYFSSHVCASSTT